MSEPKRWISVRIEHCHDNSVPTHITQSSLAIGDFELLNTEHFGGTVAQAIMGHGSGCGYCPLQILAAAVIFLDACREVDAASDDRRAFIKSAYKLLREPSEEDVQ
jgi:hypothetical protein